MELKQVQFQVAKEETQKFAAEWRHNGLAIPFQEHHIQFATDFANLVLQQFIHFCKQQALAKLAAAQEAATQQTTLVTEAS